MPGRPISPTPAIDAMRILVTRPLPDAETTAASLRKLGHEPVLAPMLMTEFADWLDVSADSLPDALIATSLNGVRGLARHPHATELQGVPVFVAGDASARLARSLGFADVRSGHGDANDLLARIKAEMPPEQRLLYAAGHDRSGDLAADLTALGFTVDLVEVYRAIAASELPETVVADIADRRVDRILVFSARTAAALVAAIDSAGLLAVSKSIPIHAISQQAAEPLRSADFRTIVVALRPDADELLDTLMTSR